MLWHGLSVTSCCIALLAASFKKFRSSRAPGLTVSYRILPHHYSTYSCTYVSPWHYSVLYTRAMLPPLTNSKNACSPTGRFGDLCSIIFQNRTHRTVRIAVAAAPLFIFKRILWCLQRWYIDRKYASLKPFKHNRLDYTLCLGKDHPSAAACLSSHQDHCWSAQTRKRPFLRRDIAYFYVLLTIQPLFGIDRLRIRNDRIR